MQEGPARSLVVDAVPVALAIGVFGVIYGATATTVLGPATTIASSVVLFSGAAQFAMVGLVDAGAGAAAVVGAVTVLALRHVPLAAVVLPHLGGHRRGRALLALVLIDETAGLAVASRRSAARTMAAVGALSYAAWVSGTAAGVVGADLVAAASLAGAVFVVLFAGLAVLTSRTATDLARAAAGALLSAGVLLVVPAAGALGVVAVAACCAATASRWRAPAGSAVRRSEP